MTAPASSASTWTWGGPSSSGCSASRPKAFEEHRHEFDFARLDTLVPHPGYAQHGFASIVMPGPQLLPEIDRLLAIAHGRAVDRRERAARRATQPEPGA